MLTCHSDKTDDYIESIFCTEATKGVIIKAYPLLCLNSSIL